MTTQNVAPRDGSGNDQPAKSIEDRLDALDQQYDRCREHLAAIRAILAELAAGR